MQENIKTMQEWKKLSEETENQISWYDFAKPGDLVDKEIFNHFLNVIPPKKYGAGYLQVGEPYSREFNKNTGKMADTYMTFEQVEYGVYRYCGNCFLGERENIE